MPNSTSAPSATRPTSCTKVSASGSAQLDFLSSKVILSVSNARVSVQPVKTSLQSVLTVQLISTSWSGTVSPSARKATTGTRPISIAKNAISIVSIVSNIQIFASAAPRDNFSTIKK